MEKNEADVTHVLSILSPPCQGKQTPSERPFLAPRFRSAGPGEQCSFALGHSLRMKEEREGALGRRPATPYHYSQLFCRRPRVLSKVHALLYERHRAPWAAYLWPLKASAVFFVPESLTRVKY